MPQHGSLWPPQTKRADTRTRKIFHNSRSSQHSLTRSFAGGEPSSSAEPLSRPSGRSTAGAAKPSLLPTRLPPRSGIWSVSPSVSQPPQRVQFKKRTKVQGGYFPASHPELVCPDQNKLTVVTSTPASMITSKVQVSLPLPSEPGRKLAAKFRLGSELLSYGSKSICCCQYLEVFF